MDLKSFAPLKQNGQLYTNSTDKDNILNQQFQSVFTPKTPLKLRQLSRMVVQDFINGGILHQSQIPGKTLYSVSQMPIITVSLNGVLKLLKDLNPHKATGPDQLNLIVLQRLRDVIAPVLQVIYQKSLDTGRVPKDCKTAYVCPLFPIKGTILSVSMSRNFNGTWSSIQVSVLSYMSHRLEPQSLVNICMGRSLNQLDAPSTWGWKSVTIFLLITTSRRYAHQQASPWDS